jgi:aflatoxin B1 aldehyde reductase
VPLSSTLAGVNEVYKKGYFTRFGLSNYRAEDVEAVYDYCKQHDYVLPTAYQGNYSAVARKPDTVLFPTLRKLGIAFYAYSPLAGGFLTRTKEQVAAGEGRFGDFLGGMYKDMYAKPTYLAALSEWAAIADDVGCSRADLAYRWVAYNSPLKPEYGDGVIVGASKLTQLEQTLEGLKAGPLPDDAVQRIERIWKTVEHEAPLDNYNR